MAQRGRFLTWWNSPLVSNWITKAVFLFYASALTSFGIIMQHLGTGYLLFSLIYYMLGTGCLWLALNSRRLSDRAVHKSDKT